MTHTNLRPVALASSLAALVVCLLMACGAAAQARTPGNTALAEGLALDEVLAQTGLTLLDVGVPVEAGLPVRLELARGAGADGSSDNRVALLVDVRVLADAGAARELLATIAPALSSHGVSSVPNLGDAAVGDDARTVVAFARANVLVVARAIEHDGAPTLDAVALAGRLVVACDASPRLRAGHSASAAVALPTVTLQPGTATLAMPRGAIAMRVHTDGDATARRLADGWEVTRGTGASEVQVIAVDALLRVAR